MLNEPVLSKVEGVKHLALSEEKTICSRAGFFHFDSAQG
jgi:hypothetical protein